MAAAAEILDTAKIEAGEPSVSSRRAWGAEALDVALAVIRPEAAAKGIDPVDSCDRARDTTYLGDPERVQQILVKLLGNAIKFTEPGGRVVVDCDTAERIARRLARLMGGDITVDSRLGEGSCFALWLPAASARREPSNSA